jgi:hypothetical protein
MLNKLTLLISVLLSVYFVSAQDHSKAIDRINTVQEAEAYAETYREVSVSFINAQSDRIVFDKIDTNDMSSNLGKEISFFGRMIKLLKDTTLNMVDVRMITFDLKEMDITTAELLRNQIKKRLEAGERYWDVKQKYGHTSAKFFSGPMYCDVFEGKTGLKGKDLNTNEIILFDLDENSIGIVIPEKSSFPVPAFYTIGFNQIR